MPPTVQIPSAQLVKLGHRHHAAAVHYSYIIYARDACPWPWPLGAPAWRPGDLLGVLIPGANPQAQHKRHGTHSLRLRLRGGSLGACAVVHYKGPCVLGTVGFFANGALRARLSWLVKLHEEL